jgi:hypothetical protein
MYYPDRRAYGVRDRPGRAHPPGTAALLKPRAGDHKGGLYWVVWLR